MSGLPTVVALAAAAGWIAGAEGAVGVAGGGAIALVNFRWLAKSAARMAAFAREDRSVVVGWRGMWLRHLLTVGAVGFLVGGGWA
ncbi:MAG: ATP synthase subunit I, partial [Candidatus Rokuibacteriota bacterium]